MVSREPSAASDVIDLVGDDSDDGDDHIDCGKLPHQQCMGDNSMRFRGGRQSKSSSFLESDVIDLVDGSGDEITKRRKIQADISSLSSATNQRRRSSYDEPTEPKDHAAITHGIIDLLDQLRGANTLTCAGGRVGCSEISSSRQQIPQPRYNHQPLHYQQNDNWSCGYRNLQMMISSMLPAARAVFPTGVPSIHEIQSTMEQMWKKGFDLESAQHHKYSLVGKTSQIAFIGTLEAWGYLSFLGVDAAIVQFVNKEANRAMIGDFIWNYFAKRVGPDGCSCIDDVTIVQPGSPPIAVPLLSSFEYGCRLFNTRPVNDCDSTLRSSCTCALPSLYLQWEGHSITVVGIRKMKNTNESSPPTFNLIVFDPHVRGAQTKAQLEKGVDAKDALESVLTNISTKRIKFELPVNELVRKRKNIQILLSTGAILDESERAKRTKCRPGFNCITAATTYPLNREYASLKP